MIERLYSAVKRRRCGRAVTSESETGWRRPGAGAPAALAAEEESILLVLIKVRFLSPPYSNCPGSTCLTHLGTEGVDQVIVGFAGDDFLPQSRTIDCPK